VGHHGDARGEVPPRAEASAPDAEGLVGEVVLPLEQEVADDQEDVAVASGGEGAPERIEARPTGRVERDEQPLDDEHLGERGRARDRPYESIELACDRPPGLRDDRHRRSVSRHEDARTREQRLEAQAPLARQLAEGLEVDLLETPKLSAL
jgi:hypothetical protein